MNKKIQEKTDFLRELFTKKMFSLILAIISIIIAVLNLTNIISIYGFKTPEPNLSIPTTQAEELPTMECEVFSDATSESIESMEENLDTNSVLSFDNNENTISQNIQQLDSSLGEIELKINQISDDIYSLQRIEDALIDNPEEAISAIMLKKDFENYRLLIDTKLDIYINEVNMLKQSVFWASLSLILAILFSSIIPNLVSIFKNKETPNMGSKTGREK